MKRRLMDNIKMIGVLVALFLALSGGLYKVWSVESQVKENTYWIDEERYDRLEGRVAYKEVNCGEDAVRCSEKDQKLIRRWKRQIRRLGKKLGYE